MQDATQYTGRKGRKPSIAAEVLDKQPTGLIVDSILPPSPVELSREAVEEYNRVGEYLLLTSRVSKLDLQALAVYSASYAFYSDAMRPLIIGRNRIWDFVNDKAKPSKLVSVAMQHGKIALYQARRFGMTARTRHLDFVHGMGRPATPKQIKDLQSGRARRTEPADWHPDSVAMPNWFDPRARNEWHRLTDALRVNDLWTPLDVGPIALCCASFSLLLRCAAEMSDDALAVRVGDTNQFVEHPLSQIYRDHYWLCQSIWTDYGMSPHDRAQFLHVEGASQGKPRLSVYAETSAG